MYDVTDNTQHVKYVAKHSSVIPRWRVIAELYMRVENESMLADFVVCGKKTIQIKLSDFRPYIQIYLNVFSVCPCLPVVSYRMKSATTMNN